MKSKELLAMSLEPSSNPIALLMYEVSNTSSKLEKEQLLNNQMSPVLQQILKDTYGPQKYNVKAYEVDQIGELTFADYNTFHELLEQLAARELTGNAAKDAINHIMSMYNLETQVILARILDRNLKIGAGNTFAQDAGTVKKFPVRLANSYKDVQHRIDIFDANWLISRKLDGCRCLAFVSVDENMKVEVEFRSRQNKVINTLDNLKSDYEYVFSKYTPGNYVVDGEICIIDENGHEQFHGLMSEITRKNHTIKRPVHITYDFLTEDEFWGNEPSSTFFERIATLQDVIKTSYSLEHLKVLHQEILESKEQLEDLQARVSREGWEGLMVAKNVPYDGKRTNNILKIKKFMDGEYVVKDIIVNEQSRCTDTGTEIVTTTSALVIEHKGNIVKVGSGMSYAQRDEWYKHPERIIGKTIGIRYFEESEDSKTGLKSLRFPTLYIVYEDGRQV